MRYPFYVHIIIPAARQAIAQALAATILNRSSDSGAFTIGLSASGNAPITNYIYTAPYSGDHRARFNAAIDNVVGVNYFVLNNQNGNLILTNHVASQAQQGNAWDAVKTLTALGLKRI